jgi:hypothetical protein
MILDRLLAAFFLLTLLGFFGIILWFVPELDLVVITLVVSAIAAYFLLVAPFRRSGRGESERRRGR